MEQGINLIITQLDGIKIDHCTKCLITSESDYACG